MEDRDVDVCVVGAGFAGLAAARRLREKNKTVALLEARDRVGGRVWNKTLKDGTVISVGGTWLGKGHDRMKAFAEAAKLSTYPQYGLDDPDDPLGEHLPEMILRLDGVNKRYKDSPVVASIDQCPKAPAGGGQPIGVLSSYSIGSKALQLSEMDPVARKALWLKELADRFDDPAALTPRDYSETDWSAEQWSQGAMIAHFPPGVLTTFGHVLHQPCGPIYWAGAERATLMHGLMEGAARSGEQAAADVMSKLG